METIPGMHHWEAGKISPLREEKNKEGRAFYLGRQLPEQVAAVSKRTGAVSGIMDRRRTSKQRPWRLGLK